MSFSKYTLNNVRSLSNYGLYVSGNTIDPIFSKGWIQTKPNILIKGGSCYIDYSHAYNASDLVYLNQTFGVLGTGAVFYMKPSGYFDQEKNILKNLGGTLSVNQLLNDKRLIVANIVSGIDGITGYDYFVKENFTDIPQFQFQTSASFTGYYLINSLPHLSKTTFESMGILGNIFGYEEYVEMSTGICQNSGLIEVKGAAVFKDTQEILYFLNGGTYQDSGNTLTSVNLYLRGNPELLKAPRSTNVTGIYTVSNVNTNSLVQCFENQTLNQATLRRESLNSALYTSEFVNCENCQELAYGSGSTTTFETIGDYFNTLIFLYVVDGATVNVSNSLVGSVAVNTTTLIRVPTTSTKTIKIDLSHPTLIDYDLTIYTDPSRKIILGNNKFIKYGVVGYNNSFGIIKNYVPDTTLYCTLQGPSTVEFSITV